MRLRCRVSSQKRPLNSCHGPSWNDCSGLDYGTFSLHGYSNGKPDRKCLFQLNSNLILLPWYEDAEAVVIITHTHELTVIWSFWSDADEVPVFCMVATSRRLLFLFAPHGSFELLLYVVLLYRRIFYVRLVGQITVLFAMRDPPKNQQCYPRIINVWCCEHCCEYAQRNILRRSLRYRHFCILASDFIALRYIPLR